MKTTNLVSLKRIDKSHNDLPDPTAALSVPCCDICCPDLLDLTRPGPPVSIQKASALKLGIPNSEVIQSVHEWRRKIWNRDFPNALFGPSGILCDESVNSLASVGPILSLIQLEKVVGESWPWFGKYGDELLEELEKMSIPPLQPKPKQPRGRKKALDEQDKVEERSNKRSRTSRTTSLKKATQNPDPSLPETAVPHFPPTLPATPLPHNPYMHLLTPTASGSSPSLYLGYQPQPPTHQYSYYNFQVPQSGSPNMSFQHHETPHQHSSNIASSSKSLFPPTKLQFHSYTPKK